MQRFSHYHVHKVHARTDGRIHGTTAALLYHHRTALCRDNYYIPTAMRCAGIIKIRNDIIFPGHTSLPAYRSDQHVHFQQICLSWERLPQLPLFHIKILILIHYILISVHSVSAQPYLVITLELCRSLWVVSNFFWRFSIHSGKSLASSNTDSHLKGDNKGRYSGNGASRLRTMCWKWKKN